MSRASLSLLTFLGIFSLLAANSRADLTETPETGSVEAVISVADQRMMVLRDGEWIARFPVSTSKFGIGDSAGSYKTPLGRLRVCDKLGGGLASGMVIKHRQATGEVLPVNAPGRDPIVTRILWLEGCESQNVNARGRSIYIHGTPEEREIGKPVSWGCIRMRSADVIALYDDLPMGASVTIVPDRLPHYPKYAPKPEQIIAATPKELPPPIAAQEKPIRTPVTSNSPGASVVRTTPQALTAAAARKVEVAPVAVTRKTADPASAAAPHAETQVASNGTSHKIPDPFRGSILLSGVGEANSEIPQLRQ